MIKNDGDDNDVVGVVGVMWCGVVFLLGLLGLADDVGSQPSSLFLKY